MQGIGHILAGAALLAGAYAAPATRSRAWGADVQPQADETALAVPRITMPYGGNVPLPTPLAPSEAALVSRVFDLQKAGKLSQADQATALLGDNLLLGHLRADRLLRQGGGAPVAALKAWLAVYRDHPEVPAVYALLLRVIPDRHAAPAPPKIALLAPHAAAPPADALDDSDPRARHNLALGASLLTLVHNGKPDAAEALLAHTRGVTPEYAAVLHGTMARAWFIAGRDALAFDTAARGWNEDQRNGNPAYVAGLAAWRMGDIETSRSWFEASATAYDADSALRSAAAFWAARAAQKQLDRTAAQAWLAVAARERRTFYGLLANRLLGRPIAFNQDRGVLGEAEVQAIAATPQGNRAFALLQVGQNGLAEAEFRALWPTLAGQTAMRRALLLVCDQAGLYGLGSQLAALLGTPDDDDLARSAVPPLHPARGFTVDQPLVYALARIESNFRPGAISAAGARGLLQLTPRTANFVSGGGAGSLHNPAVNLEIGQRYLSYLASTDTVNEDLVRLLAAYNSGPGAVSHWNMQDHGDPLLYIESIPVDETRAFVPRALAYSWIYAARFHLPAESLDTLAGGAWPQFVGRTVH